MTRELFYVALGALVAYRRKQLKLTQAALATQLGLSQPTIARLEAGGWAVPVSSTAELAKFLGLAGVGLLHDCVENVVKLTQRAADAIRPGSLDRLPPRGLAAFVVAMTESTGGHRRRTSAPLRPASRQPTPRPK